MNRGAGWLYRLVVATCPRDFRRLYAADMTDLFERRLALERSRGPWRAWRYVCRSLLDTAAVALRLRHGPARRPKTPAPGRGDGPLMGIVQDARFAVRSWLRGLPGMVQDGDSDGVVRKAWAAFARLTTRSPKSSGHGNLELFRVALEREGFRVEPLGAKFILRLPSKPTGNADWERIRRMNNIAR